MDREVRIVLFGYGRVGREFAAVLASSRANILRRYGVDLRLAAIRGQSQQLLLKGDSVPPRTAWSPGEAIETFLQQTGGSVTVQAIPSTDALASVALSQTIAAFEAGMDVVSATKSHLVRHWGDISDAARASGRRIRISAATGAALPAADVARVSLRGFACARIRGCLNGTSNFVLERLEGGSTLADAVSAAQALGIAESDPRGDLEGRDAASKIVLLANLLWDRHTTIDEVDCDAIDDAIDEKMRHAREGGRRLRAVAMAEAGTEVLTVRLDETEPGDPLYALRGSEKAVQYDCGELGQIVVSGGESSPRGTAHALVKDTLDVILSRGLVGFG